MTSRLNFMRIVAAIVVVILLAITSFSNTPVRANVVAQATMEASATANATSTISDATTAATGVPAATGIATVLPTIGGDEAYPPCPAMVVMTQAATAASTTAPIAATGEAAATAVATADSMAGMDTGTGASATVSATVESAAPISAAATEIATAVASEVPTANPTSAVQMGPFKTLNGCSLTATLAGANEVPKPGDPDATGNATLTIARPESGSGEICFQIETTNLTLPVKAAHIHAGPAGIAGPVVIPLNAPDDSGKISGCVSGVDRSLLKTLLLYPGSYYVNVHTSDFPDGAMRGQLQGSSGQ